MLEPRVRDYVRCPHADGSWFEGTVLVIDGPVLDPIYYSIKVERVSEPPPVLDHGPVRVGQRVLSAAPRSIRNIVVVDRGNVEGAGEDADMRKLRARRDGRVSAAETLGSALAVLRRLDYSCLDADIRTSITRARSTLSVAQSKIKERTDE